MRERKLIAERARGWGRVWLHIMGFGATLCLTCVGDVVSGDTRTYEVWGYNDERTSGFGELEVRNKLNSIWSKYQFATNCLCCLCCGFDLGGKRCPAPLQEGRFRMLVRNSFPPFV